MSPLRISILAGGIAALVTLGVHYRVRQNLLREVAHLRADNDALRFEANRRREAFRPKKPVFNVGHADAEDSSRAEIAEPGRLPVAEYRNEGQATPLATLQTMAWASDRGDAELMGKMIFFDPEAQAKTTAYFASLPPEARAQWSSMETMAASLLTAAGIRNPFPSAAILERATIEPIDSNRVRLRLPGTSRELTEYQKTAEGWKFAITGPMVDGYLSHQAETKPGAK